MVSAATPIQLVVTDLTNNPGASGSARADLGWEKAHVDFNCGNVNGDVSCRMVKCGYSMWATKVSCSAPLTCDGTAKPVLDGTLNRDTVTAYYELTDHSYGCKMYAF